MINDVVDLNVDNGIAKIQLIDRMARNTFSKQLIQGLNNVFQQVKNNTSIKVVIIYGYDNYFCCGGTQEELIDMALGKVTFVELGFYRLLLDCEVPTIAAMQGHAIGGGLAFGCYADFIILAEECIYSANFMKYGFTPGMGATYLLPKKFGEVVGNEMLYTADTYSGGVLKNKGIKVPVVKKTDVLAKALELAQQFIDKPLSALKLLKAHLTHEIKTNLPKIIQQELAMHRITFVEPEVRMKIEELFNQ